MARCRMASSVPSSVGCQSSSFGEIASAPKLGSLLIFFVHRYAATKAIVLSTVATAFPFFDIPVFWPILLVYFIVLFVITMRRQIGHMRKYK